MGLQSSDTGSRSPTSSLSSQLQDALPTSQRLHATDFSAIALMHDLSELQMFIILTAARPVCHRVKKREGGVCLFAPVRSFLNKS